jgi:hypothetical protein
VSHEALHGEDRHERDDHPRTPGPCGTSA